MLPRLDRLSLFPTGVRAPNLPDDLIRAVLDAVAAGDAEDACRAAASWCAVDRDNKRVCDENWERLTDLVFANAPVIVPNNARANFYALCNRARSYRLKRRRLNAWSSQEDGDVKVFVLAALSWDPQARPWVSPRLQADPEVQLAIKELEYRNGYRMLSEHPEDQSVRRLVLAEFKNSHSANLDDVSEELRSDPQILLAFLKVWDHDPYSFTKDDLDEVVPEELLNDRSFVLELARLGQWNVLKVVPERFQKDREVVLAAVQSNGLALSFALEQFRNDREIVIAALKKNGSSFPYVSWNLRKDREIVMIAIASQRVVPSYADHPVLGFVPSKELRNDRELVLAAVRYNASEFEFASDELKSDREFVIEAVKLHFCTFQYASKELRDDDEVVALALYEEGHKLQDVRCDGWEGVLAYASEAQQRKFDEWIDEWAKTHELKALQDALWARYQKIASR